MSSQDKLGKMNSLRAAWNNCSRCPLASLRKKIVWGDGNINAKLVFIGEAPGGDEDEHGKPFIGDAGHKLDAMLAAVRISRSDIWITNTCMCRPKLTGVPGKTNRAPTVKEISACFPRLEEEINIIRPEIIVLAGNTPLLLATGKRGITKNRGWQKAVWNGDGFVVSKIYATLHPASLLYGSAEQRKTKGLWMYEDWLDIARSLSSVKKSQRDN